MRVYKGSALTGQTIAVKEKEILKKTLGAVGACMKGAELTTKAGS